MLKTPHGKLAAAVLALAAAAFVSPAFAADSVLPPDACKTFPAVRDIESLRAVLRAAPHFFKQVEKNRYRLIVPLVEIPEEAGVSIMDRTSDKGWSGVQFVADPQFRGQCAFYIRASTLKVLDEKFLLDLATPLSVTDQSGKTSTMLTMVLGRNQVSLYYNLKRTKYYNPRAKRTLSYKQRVYFGVTVAPKNGGQEIYLEDINGLSVNTGFPFGWESIAKIRLKQGRLHSWVLGKWRGGDPAIPIRRIKSAQTFWAEYNKPRVVRVDPSELVTSGRSLANPGIMRRSGAFQSLQRLQAAPAFR